MEDMLAEAAAAAAAEAELENMSASQDEEEAAFTQEGVSASNTRGMGWAQAVYAIPRALLHHLFCELKLGERLKEASALAVGDGPDSSIDGVDGRGHHKAARY
ncbi:hypothetical protein CYMTET_56173 [Cymbomonas tetramitiformis]|uniref:Uncharacterized protein n=1 Tax=Cymbomonas tetramitiformis TaxID=36881 RepID=A0AAE0BCT9_9CHLO|nr:hypothetical protein CYMTET_56173 [Cymbomonas tetramitiformis]